MLGRKSFRAKSNLELFHSMIAKTQTNFNNADRLFTVLLLRQSYPHYIVPPRGIFTLFIYSYKAFEIHLEIIHWLSMRHMARFIERNFIYIARGLIPDWFFSKRKKEKYSALSLDTNECLSQRKFTPETNVDVRVNMPDAIYALWEKKQNKKKNRNARSSFAPTCPGVSRMHLYLLPPE